MKTPIRAFWLLNANIGRVLAEKDLRLMAVQSSRHGGDGAKDIRDHLVLEMGDAMKVDREKEIMSAQRDEAGFNELRFMM